METSSPDLSSGTKYETDPLDYLIQAALIRSAYLARGTNLWGGTRVYPTNEFQDHSFYIYGNENPISQG